MSLHIYRSRLKIVDHHITTKAAGNIESLSKKLALSVAGAYKFLEEMKEEGFPIVYSKKENRYCYTKKGRMVGYVFMEDTTDFGEEKSVGGGGKNFLKIFSDYNYSRIWESNFV